MSSNKRNTQKCCQSKERVSACCEILKNLSKVYLIPLCTTEYSLSVSYQTSEKCFLSQMQNRWMCLCEPKAEEQKAVLCGSRSQSRCNYPVNSCRLPRQRFRQDESAWRGNSKPLDESQNHFSLCNRGDKATKHPTG